MIPPVIPVKAGIHSRNVGDGAALVADRDSRLRGNDGVYWA
jgi:hypothetical protein